MKREYQQEHLDELFAKAATVERKELLKSKEKNNTKNNLLFITYNKTLPRIQTAIDNNWDLLKIDDNIGDTFKDKQKKVYQRNRK